MTALRDARLAPSPREDFVLGHLLRRQRDPLGLYLHAAETLGDFTRFRFFDKTLFLVTSPGGIGRVLQDNVQNYVKGFGYAAMKLVMGEGLVTAEGEAWQEQRKRTQPAFQSTHMAKLRSTMSDAVERAVEQWPKQGGPIDAFRACLQLSRSVASRTLFSLENGAEVLDELVPFLQREVTRRSLSLWPSFPWRTPADRKFARAVGQLDEFIHGVIDRRRALEAPPDDLLQSLISAWPQPESRKKLRDALVTLFLAAYETTATSLTWTLELLARHPQIADRLHDEVTTRPGDQLVFTRQVIDASLRLRPSVWLFARKAVSEDVIGEYQVPAGSYVLVSPWVNHRLSRLWSDPETFDPDRFAPEARARIPKFAFLPFSAGPRACIGAGFAMLELIASVAAIVKRYRIAPNGKVPAFDPQITLQPRGGMPLLLTPRRS
jgi:cytochrome P450